MATTVKIDDETHATLTRVSLNLSARAGRRLTHNETLRAALLTADRHPDELRAALDTPDQEGTDNE